MSVLGTSIKVINVLICCLFVSCCYFTLNVNSEISDKQTALTVVETEENSDDVEVSVEDGGEEISYDPLNVFIPTKEWQTVQPDQAIPSGLHVRLNLETGLKEAKLMEGDTQSKYWKLGEKQGMVNPNKKFTRDELKRALKDFKAESIINPSPENIDKFKSYKEIKKDFEDMNIGVKTDVEIITELLDKLQKPDINDQNLKTILTDLEYYLHQIDNAVYFCDARGLEVLLRFLNHTSEAIRSETALVLGSALQSNPKAQISAVESGLLQPLIRIMSIEKSVSLRKRILYALSSLIRHFPYAQLKFIELGGLSVFSKIFEETGTEVLQIKTITLLNDIILEKTLTENDPQETGVYKEKIKQYNQLNIKEAMVVGGWCELIPRLLTLPEHDSREKVINSMTTLLHPCLEQFSVFRPVILNLREEYRKLSHEDVDDDYFTNLYVSLKHIASQLHVIEL
ncbi:nucleotide exchange factor SIL1 isoform X1 [Patella vulgata]|uniref:nucleotide exchange factor SIL1 isoform X1 n=1 Tax=Patella vulgata TaxID=6465 RepID=UPI002180670E|nr:nucleotide exchange factor SIL1 isoform X1 [Patella vulgata]XP_050399020.1 nucleotide exchange factor SIL1 isoform X1 [Patella vulgata]